MSKRMLLFACDVEYYYFVDFNLIKVGLVAVCLLEDEYQPRRHDRCPMHDC